MIAREKDAERMDIWARLAAALPSAAIDWRQDGKPLQRNGGYVARFVAYIDAQTVRERLDSVVPGEWDLTLEMLPHASDSDGVALCAFKARLQVLGVLREDVGQGSDYKQAATDSFKRAAVRFGIGHELYRMEQLWVPVDGEGKFAKPLKDPAQVYAEKYGSGANGAKERAAPLPQTPASGTSAVGEEAPAAAPAPRAEPEPSCPKCGGRLWDNRLSKRNPKAPDYKCRSRSCDGCIWPLRNEKRQPDVIAADGQPEYADDPFADERDLPF